MPPNIALYNYLCIKTLLQLFGKHKKISDDFGVCLTCKYFQSLQKLYSSLRTLATLLWVLTHRGFENVSTRRHLAKGDLLEVLGGTTAVTPTFLYQSPTDARRLMSQQASQRSLWSFGLLCRNLFLFIYDILFRN